MTNSLARDPLDFSDLEEDLDKPSANPHRDIAREAAATVWSNPCPKCQGSKVFRSYSGRVVGPCHFCKGAGVLTFKTSPEQRERAKAKANQRKADKLTNNWTSFATMHADLAAWIKRNPSFGFAIAMKDKVEKFGELTPNQAAAIYRCMEKDAAREVAKVAKIEQAKSVDVSRIETIFKTASSNGLKKPTLRVGELKLSLASTASANAGAVYVKRGETYLGKIIGGEFKPSWSAKPDDIVLIEETAKDPLALAIAYGKRTGNCSCCGRVLSDPVSVANGIGPICQTKYGF